MKGILLPPALGKISDYTPELTFTETEKINSVTTIVLDDSYGNAASIRGSVIDDDAQYLLYVDHNMESIKQLEAAVEAEYGDLVNGQLNTFDLTMVEMKSGVPISNFGDTGVELRIPISEMLMKQDICAVTLNEEGRLQTIYGTKQTDEDGSCFVFKTNHFSTYGIYAGIGEMAEKIELESQRLLKKDVTPDTGEAFNPKWLLAIFCGLTGLVLLINRPYFIRDFKVKQDNF